MTSRVGCRGPSGALLALLAGALFAGPAAPAGAAGRTAHAAHAARAVVLHANGSARRTFRTTADRTQVVVRASGRPCAGNPRAAVRLDGAGWQSLHLHRRARDYRLAPVVKPGVHALRVRFRSDRTRRGRCSRSVTVGAPRLVALPPKPKDDRTGLRYVPLGAAVDWAHLQDDPAYATRAITSFDSFTPENELKMNAVQPAQGTFDFGPADGIVDFALAHGKQVRGHALIFGEQTPGWVKFVIDPNRLIDVMRVHIETVMKHFAGRIVEWDVVNEAIDSQGRFRHNVFYDRLGSRYIDLAYMFARQADPNAKLFYNDFDAEYLQPKRDAVYNLVRRLHDAGLVDGVGLQAHLDLKSPVAEPQVEQTLRLYQDAGIESEITEMDVTAGDRRVPVGDRLLSQAQQYSAVAQACQAVAACERFTVWGVTDKYSWLGQDAMPLLFDGNEQPKPAYEAVRAALGH